MRYFRFQCDERELAHRACYPESRLGHTTLAFRDRDEYFHDADVLVVLHLLLAKARSQPDQASRHPDLIPDWEHALDSTGPGFVDLDFDALSDDARHYVVELLRELQTDLNGLEALPVSTLKEWRVPDLKLGEYYEAARLRDAVSKLTRLLSDQ